MGLSPSAEESAPPARSVSSLAYIIPVSLKSLTCPWRLCLARPSDPIFVVFCCGTSSELLEGEGNRAGAVSTASTLVFEVHAKAKIRNM